MPNQNSYFGVVLDSATMASLQDTSLALQETPGELLATADDITFKPQEALHMTFVFFKEDLHGMPVEELRALHEGACEGVRSCAADAAAQPLHFLDFELFPPGKANQVAARFQPTESLVRMRRTFLEHLRKASPSLPDRFWKDIEEEGDWLPHVTLGKIGATMPQIGRLSCSQALQDRAPASAKARGLTLLGERPKRAWLNWTEELAFVAPDRLLELSLAEVLERYPLFRKAFQNGTAEQQRRWQEGWTSPDADMRSKLQLACEKGIF